MVRSNVLRLAYLPLWGSLQPGRLALELRPFPQLKRHWQHLKAKEGQGQGEGGMTAMERYEYDFLPSLVRMFLSSVERFGEIKSWDEMSRVGSSQDQGERVEDERISGRQEREGGERGRHSGRNRRGAGVVFCCE